MTKKQLKELVNASYSGNKLDEKKVEKIGSALSRSNLKKYIRALKHSEDSKTVIVTIPAIDKGTEKSIESEFTTLFPDKNIVLEIDPSLLVGLRVKNNDLIYEENLKETLENMLEYLKD